MGLMDRILGRTKPPETSREPVPDASPVFAVLDVETTGLSPGRSRVIELGVVLADSDGRPVWEWQSRFNPQGPVGATEIHGITGDDVVNAPLFADQASVIAGVLSGRVLVGHNVQFDVAFLRAEFARAGWEVPAVPVLCTMEAGRAYLPHLPRHRLADCCHECGVTLRDAHSALGDARATTDLLGVYLRQTSDRGGWLGWQAAAAEATRVPWPRTPSRAPVAWAPDPRARMAANSTRTKAEGPRLVQIVRTVNLADVLDEGAPQVALAYLELLAESLEDGVLDREEGDALDELAATLGLGPSDVAQANKAFMLALAHVALADGKVTRAERAEFETIAALLAVDPEFVSELMHVAEEARRAHLSQGLKALPDDWDLGEPLRVGDKIVFTGCEAWNRDALEQRAARLGVRVVGAVSRRVAALISDGTMDGAKVAAARSLGTRVVHPHDLPRLLDYLQPAPPPEGPGEHAAMRHPHLTDPANVATEQGPVAAAAPTIRVSATGSDPAVASEPRVAPAAIRAWAKQNGIAVGERGRLHATVIEAYEQAHQGAKAGN